MNNRIAHLLIQADARRIPLPDKSVHCVVTSPPYWGLRDYGVGGQIGLEATPDAFVAEMVRVFREVWRVLRDDGTLWLNLGDSYARNGGEPGGGNRELMHLEGTQTRMCSIPDGVSLKPKDLVGIPWRVALALQADGWYLRSDIIWAKPNPMPESVADRPTKSHEYLFLMAKRESYYFDAEAVRRIGSGTHSRGGAMARPGVDTNGGNQASGRDFLTPETGANQRTVWPIATEAYPGAHFATYPRKLVEPCVKAGTSERGVCPDCGAPWERVVEASYENPGNRTTNGDRSLDRRHETAGFAVRLERRSTTTGWRPTCSHDRDPVPATVLDPFAGSGTTLVVANALGRRAVGLDLSREYLGLAAHRITRPHAAVPRPGRDEHHPLFEGAPC